MDSIIFTEAIKFHAKELPFSENSFLLWLEDIKFTTGFENFKKIEMEIIFKTPNEKFPKDPPKIDTIKLFLSNFENPAHNPEHKWLIVQQQYSIPAKCEWIEFKIISQNNAELEFKLRYEIKY